MPHLTANHSCSGFTVSSPCRSAWHAPTAAWAAASVVMHVTPCATAAARILPSSVRAPLPLGVLMISAICAVLHVVEQVRPAFLQLAASSSTAMPALAQHAWPCRAVRDQLVAHLRELRGRSAPRPACRGRRR